MNKRGGPAFSRDIPLPIFSIIIETYLIGFHLEKRDIHFYIWESYLNYTKGTFFLFVWKIILL